MLKTLIEKFPQKKKTLLSISSVQLFLFFPRKIFFSTNSQIFIVPRHICILVDRVDSISSSKLQKHGAYQVETSVSTQLTPPNFDRGGVYYVGSMPIHHALQVSALLREEMFRGYL